MTFPGAFHAGLSTGWNVGEANNVAFESWLDFMDDGYNICISSREKVPCFPKEFIIMENISRFLTIDLPQSTWKKLWKHFVQMLIDERDA